MTQSPGSPRRVINARGTYTPLGVSRASPGVAAAVAQVLQQFVLVDALHDAVGTQLARWAGAEAGAVTHCTAASLTLAVAACMAGTDAGRIAQLPDATGLPAQVVLPASHAVHYGHPLTTAIRLAGARPVLAGTAQGCTVGELARAVVPGQTACVLLVSSRLVQGEPVDLAGMVAAAHALGVPVVLDGAAQALRVQALLATGADLVLVSAQKYLAAPTAGLVLGRAARVQAVRAQEQGIGRAMKPTKEALAGVAAALQEHQALDLPAWAAQQQARVAAFVAAAGALPGVQARAEPDPTGLPLHRARLALASGAAAVALARQLRDGTPCIWVMDHEAQAGVLWLELAPLTDEEIAETLQALKLLLI